MRIKDYNFKTILENPNLKAWYTQNLDNTLSHPKLKPLPLGINFYKSAASQKEYNSAYDQDYVLQRTNQKLLPTGKRKLRVFADTHLVNSSTRHRSDGILSRFEVHKILENNQKKTKIFTKRNSHKNIKMVTKNYQPLTNGTTQSPSSKRILF